MDEKVMIHLEHEAHTDVMYADFCPPAEDADIQVVDIGSSFSFPEGQVLARFDNRNQVLLGLTIQDYRHFRSRLVWQYRMASVTRAIQWLANAARMMQTGIPKHGGTCLAAR